MVALLYKSSINIDDYTGDENEEKNPYPVNDFPGIPSVGVNFPDTLLPSTEFHLVRDEGKLPFLHSALNEGA
ncbi:hypothetical protein NFI96_007071 [Prochilodus magdalenae]|nr:hypothetical protein NFI96_007071 [Prochilodus magdalenae]